MTFARVSVEHSFTSFTKPHPKPRSVLKRNVSAVPKLQAQKKCAPNDLDERPTCGVSPEYAEAHLAVAVEVGVEAHAPVVRGHEANPRWLYRVVRGALEQEVEEAPLVGRVEGARHQRVDLEGRHTARGTA